MKGKKARKAKFLFILLLTSIIILTGCWNYREIDKMAIVSGVAVDKNLENDKFLLTVEIINISEQDQSMSSSILLGEGDTVFDAIRNIIQVSGEKLYWGHAKIIIIGEDAAKDGVVEIIDFITRDAETRIDMDVLIANERDARDLWNEVPITTKILAYEIEEMLKSQKDLLKAPKIEIYKFINAISAKGESAIAPAIDLTENRGKEKAEVVGTAVFRKDKLIGFLDERNTKYLLFIKDDVNGGLIIPYDKSEDSNTVKVTLEVFKNKTRLKPVYVDGKLSMDIDIKMEVSLAEIGGTRNYIDEEGREKLKKDAEENFKQNIQGVIKEVQENFGVDVFGFGSTTRKEMPKLWRQIESQWEAIFRELEVNVFVTIDISNSGLTSKPIKIGD